MISGTSARRPGPASSRSAISPTLGPTKRMPSACSCATLRCVAGCSHMRGFMAGATSTGLSVAISTVEARSSAWPPAILASRSAVAGATMIRSASRDSRIWPISCSSLRSNRSVNTRSVGQRADRQRRHELRRGARHHGAHRGAVLAQAADQVEALVGGDAAADEKQDTLLFHVGRSTVLAAGKLAQPPAARG